MKKPLVSVLMPVFNGELYLKAAIQSILNQTFSDFEFIIIDDGSSDNTIEIVNSFDDQRIFLIEQEHLGISKSLNAGLKICKGEYVARMDADDLSDPARLEKQVTYLNEYPDIGAVASCVKYESFDKLGGGYNEYVNWTNSLLTPEDIAKNRFVESPIAHPSILFRRNLIKLYGDYTIEKIPEDYELWLRWLDNGVYIAKIDADLLIWNDRKDRLSRIDSHYAEEAFYELKSVYFLKWYQKEGGNKKVFVWGRGKVMRRRLAYLIAKGLDVSGFIDISKNPETQNIYFEETEVYKAGIVLGFVADRKGKSEISAFLEKNHLREGINFFHMV